MVDLRLLSSEVGLRLLAIEVDLRLLSSEVGLRLLSSEVDLRLLASEVDLRLPILSGHVCVSSGKFCRCIGQLALIVSLQAPSKPAACSTKYDA